jgi:hypothetical protein
MIQQITYCVDNNITATSIDKRFSALAIDTHARINFVRLIEGAVVFGIIIWTILMLHHVLMGIRHQIIELGRKGKSIARRERFAAGRCPVCQYEIGELWERGCPECGWGCRHRGDH